MRQHSIEPSRWSPRRHYQNSQHTIASALVSLSIGQGAERRQRHGLRLRRSPTWPDRRSGRSSLIESHGTYDPQSANLQGRSIFRNCAASGTCCGYGGAGASVSGVGLCLKAGPAGVLYHQVRKNEKRHLGGLPSGRIFNVYVFHSHVLSMRHTLLARHRFRGWFLAPMCCVSSIAPKIIGEGWASATLSQWMMSAAASAFDRCGSASPASFGTPSPSKEEAKRRREGVSG